MWVGREGSAVSLKEMASFLGMSTGLKAPGADAFHTGASRGGTAVPPHCLFPALEELAQSRVCSWHSQIGLNSRNGVIILLGLYLSPQSLFHKSYRELLSSADDFQVLVWMRAGNLAVKPVSLC